MKKSDVIEELKHMKMNRNWIKTKSEQFYAILILENLEDVDELPDDPKEMGNLHNILLNGATDWFEYSRGGCALTDFWEIVEVLSGDRLDRLGKRARQNRLDKTDWLDWQGQALWQAENRIMYAMASVMGKDKDYYFSPLNDAREIRKK